MTISVVGLGLIGGSMALSLKENGFADTIIGVDNKTEHIIKALELKLIDRIALLQDAIKQSDIIILAVPVDALLTLLPEVLNQITENQVVIEVGSTKKAVIDAVKNHLNRANFVATHPMAGTEFSGPEAAIRNLFDHKNCVLCDIEDSKPELVELIKKMYVEGLKMRITYLDSTAHDIHTAYISHISHICSFALASTVLAKEKDEESIFNLASTGFESTVRLAKSSPETWIPIFRQNQENIIDVLDAYITTLLKFKGLMISDSYEKFGEYLTQANDIKRILNK
ncbi:MULTISPECIES: prephenate dehydrogenase [unclassified Arcicella]|uniref:prephenate dehydrogenase n=1 Tax=unclassified Arcicella TaxID=2644986 RepID=UPI00285A2B9F|nr:MULTISPECIES: prephenate dehydrogenase [unclassified Arcicella]MDR6560817.1 prephenate dehydrogenase [Arcicella sp. BE51]MDR6810701.1 prephenate dehydrogenase [Arcicella sp. BE140]MDR6822051.1 prephenate dehydrogenase [Arcicella sp. BE139]